ncbi:MAG: pirin family protein [Methylotenera sp.]|nr:pirin family protein [Methylotenera sp.]MDP2281161.1 pirin family protein [Methylotenera sp.]MDP3061256.1 pirin family protein [Methylotenera sp.]
MITIRKSQDRGHANHGWLDSYHSFSFAEYHDPVHMGYSVLRVINEDKIAAGGGFGMHSHRDMEIVTYMLAGELTHRDSMGNGSIIRAGDVQRMTAGSGIRHSEINALAEGEAHLLQIWITPEKTNLVPSYEQKHFSDEQKHNQWCLIASADGREGAITIHQAVDLYATALDAEHKLSLPLQQKRCAYLQVVAGEVLCAGSLLNAGDAAKIENETSVEIAAQSNAEMLWFDLPMSGA